MKRKIEFSNTARKDIEYHRKSGNQAILNKINSLILEISETPFSGTGKPEPLKYDLSGIRTSSWSIWLTTASWIRVWIIPSIK